MYLIVYKTKHCVFGMAQPQSGMAQPQGGMPPPAFLSDMFQKYDTYLK